MTKLDRQNVANLKEFSEKHDKELPDFKVFLSRDLHSYATLRDAAKGGLPIKSRTANHPQKCLYHSGCPLIKFWLSDVRIGSEE